MYNDENMLMTDLELVDEEAYEDAMQAAYEAMQEPEIVIADGATDAQREMIENINFVLNGNSHKLQEPIELDDDENGKFMCEEVVYREKQLYAQNYDVEQDCWNDLRLDGVLAESLEKLWGRLINEIF